MRIKERLHYWMWRFIPPSFSNPKEGDVIRNGLTLTKSPTNDSDNKFAAFIDTRFYISHHYEKLAPFIPEGFEIIAPPSNQNCFMYCLDISKGIFGRKDFDRELEIRGFNCIDFSMDNLNIGDIVVYYTNGAFDSVKQHAGVYVGNERVRSRWGYNSPLLEHPLEEVPRGYWNGSKRYLSIEQSPK